MTTPSPEPSRTLVPSPNKPRPDDPLTRAVADALRRIEGNYEREGSGPGSRFEGQLLEDAQARRVIAMVRAQQAREVSWVNVPGGPELSFGPCPVEGHDGDHLQVRTHEHWLCAVTLAATLAAAGVIPDPQLYGRLHWTTAQPMPDPRESRAPGDEQ